MLRFGEREIAKEKFYASKKPTKIWMSMLIISVNAHN